MKKKKMEPYIGVTLFCLDFSAIVLGEATLGRHCHCPMGDLLHPRRPVQRSQCRGPDHRRRQPPVEQAEGGGLAKKNTNSVSRNRACHLADKECIKEPPFLTFWVRLLLIYLPYNKCTTTPMQNNMLL